MCNGIRLIVTRLGDNVIEGQILTGKLAGEKRLIPRIQLDSDPQDYPYRICRRQFPVRLCFGMTINKSQGQSFQQVGVDLREDVFTHSQFYVAISRVTDVQNLYVLRPDKRGSRSCRNIVYPEVLIS